MNQVYMFMLKEYGRDEPVFMEVLEKELEMNREELEKQLQQLSGAGKIGKVNETIYFIPRIHSILKNPTLSVDKIIREKYILDKGEIIGYKSGVNFANELGLTSQTASRSIIVTNNTDLPEKEVSFYNKILSIRKAKHKINSENYRIFQILDLLTDFDKLSEEPIEKAKYKFFEYLVDTNVSLEEVIVYLECYPDKTKRVVNKIFLKVYDF
ncbi:hypothetical protein [Marinilactibacillus kalidii]|uniref:hypothetical protein n=1 Tax=Marinilactibacillus kalidii TaxID=2820274 RepID=UPI001ABDC001|nr:hypothetical protein [Marinilactibacillus kalidii]